MAMIIPFIEHINFYEWLKFRNLNGESIPDEYLPIQYIQCTGSQYIDTGLKYDKTYYYTVDCEIDNENGNQIFGMYYGYSHGVDVWGGVYQVATDNYNIINTDIPAGLRVNIVIDQATKTMSINSFSHTFTGDFFPSSSIYPVLLGAYWSAWDNTLRGYGKGKIYSFKYYENGELLRDMIPAIRKSDNKPGMYDKVTQTFFTNQGTGEFENPVYGYLSGNPPFTFNSNGNPLADYSISGNTVQSGTPTPDSPVMPQGTGERTGNLVQLYQYSFKQTNHYYADYNTVIGSSGMSDLISAINAATDVDDVCLNFETDNDAFTPNLYVTYEGGINEDKRTPPFVINKDKKVSALIVRARSGSSAYDGTVVTVSKFMLNAGSTALSYEPYGYKIPISSANTTTPIYLGEVETTRKIGKIDLGTLSWSKTASGNFYADTAILDCRIIGNAIIGNAICSDFSEVLANSVVNTPYSFSSCLNSQARPFINSTGFENMSAAEFKEAMSGVYMYYVLTTETIGIVNEPLRKIGDYADTLTNAIEIPTTTGSNTLTVDTTIQPSEVDIIYEK